MSKKFFLPALVLILSIAGSGVAQNLRSEISNQGTGNITKNSDNLDVPHEAT